LPFVLSEERAIALRGRPRGVQTRELHVIDLAERRIRDDIQDRTGRRLLAVWRGERRSRELDQLVVVEMIEVESVPDLVLTESIEDIRGLGLNLPVVAAIAGFVETDAAGDNARRDAKVLHFPGVHRWGFENVV